MELTTESEFDHETDDLEGACLHCLLVDAFETWKADNPSATYGRVAADLGFFMAEVIKGLPEGFSSPFAQIFATKHHVALNHDGDEFPTFH